MDFQRRNELSIARLGHYYDVMRTTVFGLIGLAAITEFGPEGYSIPVSALVVLLGLYGVLAGNTALVDIENLVADIEPEDRDSQYAKGVLDRNIGALRIVSATVIALAAIALLIANMS